MKPKMQKLMELTNRDRPWDYDFFVQRSEGGNFELTAWGDLEVKPPNYLIAETLEAESFACLFGMSGGGKSFLAIDWACSIAAGLPWHERAVKQGPVVYVNGEGQGDLTRRLEAWAEKREVDPGRVPFFLSKTAAQLSDPASLEAVAAAIERGAERVGDPALIVLDTLARNAGGIDENSAKDMGLIVKACDRLREQFGATILLVHHSGKTPEQGARGSSALRAAVDTEIACSSDRRGIRVSMTKSKSGPLPELPLRFRLVASAQSAVLEADEAQGPLEAGDLPKAQDRLSKSAAVALAAYEKAAKALPAGDGLVPLEAWRSAFYEASPAEPSTKRRQFSRAREELIARGRLVVTDDVYHHAQPIVLGFLVSAIRRERGEAPEAAGPVEPVQGDPEAEGEAVTASGPLQGRKTASDSDPVHEPLEARGDPEATAPNRPLLASDPDLAELNRKVQKLRDGFTSS